MFEHFRGDWAYAERIEPISSHAKHARKCLKVEYLGRIEYDFQKSRVTGPWNHKVSVSANKVKKKFHACVPLKRIVETRSSRDKKCTGCTENDLPPCLTYPSSEVVSRRPELVAKSIPVIQAKNKVTCVKFLIRVNVGLIHIISFLNFIKFFFWTCLRNFLLLYK